MSILHTHIFHGAESWGTGIVTCTSPAPLPPPCVYHIARDAANAPHRFVEGIGRKFGDKIPSVERQTTTTVLISAPDFLQNFKQVLPPPSSTTASKVEPSGATGWLKGKLYTWKCLTVALIPIFFKIVFKVVFFLFIKGKQNHFRKCETTEMYKPCVR